MRPGTWKRRGHAAPSYQGRRAIRHAVMTDERCARRAALTSPSLRASRHTLLTGNHRIPLLMRMGLLMSENHYLPLLLRLGLSMSGGTVQVMYGGMDMYGEVAVLM
jgi:hypothetical protein